MTIEKNRREMIQLAGVAAIAASALTLSTNSASAYQGNMERALSSLYSALASLREATPNKGGHKEQAVQLIQQAIDQVQQGINFADEHGGG